jgi:hypothetical protein
VPTFQVRLPMPGKAATMSEAFRLHSYAAAWRQASGPPKNGPVTRTSVSPAAWTTALFLAQGDRRRLRVQSATEVLVINRSS